MVVLKKIVHGDIDSEIIQTTANIIQKKADNGMVRCPSSREFRGMDLAVLLPFPESIRVKHTLKKLF